MIEIMGTENKNKHCLLFHCLSQEGSACDPQVLCSLPRQLQWLTTHSSLPSFLLISQEQHESRQNTAGSNLVQELCFPRDAATIWVHRIGTEGSHRDSLLPMHHKCGHLLIVQSSSDNRKRSEACSISIT